jgi:hypothetical protein
MGHFWSYIMPYNLYENRIYMVTYTSFLFLCFAIMSHSPLLLLYKDCRAFENSIDYVRRHYCIISLMRKLMEAKRLIRKKCILLILSNFFGRCEEGFKTYRSFMWYNIIRLNIPSDCNIALFSTGNNWNFIYIIALGISEMGKLRARFKTFSYKF